MDFLFPVILQKPNAAPQYMGNGCYISECGLFVTATHVLQTALDEVRGMPFLGDLEPPEWVVNGENGLCLFHKAPNEEPIQRHITGFYPKRRVARFVDICIGTTSPEGFNGQQIAVTELKPWLIGVPDVGEHVISFNYTDCEFEDGDESAFNFASDRVEGEFIGVNDEKRQFGLPYCRVRMPIQAGNSGGPVFDAQGRLWGVCSQSDSEDVTEGWVTPILETLNINVHGLTLPSGEVGNSTVQQLVDNGKIYT